MEWRSLGAGMDVVHRNTQAIPFELERNTAPKSDARPHRAVGRDQMMTFHSFIFIHPFIHSFVQEILIVDVPHGEPGRQGSFPDGPCHLQGPTTMHAGPFLGRGGCGGLLDPWQEGLLRGHGGIWSGSIGFPMDVLRGGLSRKEAG